MVRRGTYTKKVSPWARARRSIKRRWRTFKGYSKKKKFLIVGGPILAFLILTPIATYLYYANDISDQERLMNRNNTGIVLTDRSGNAFYSVGRAQHRALLPLSEIPKITQQALIASEDKDFYEHSGFSIGGFFRALFGTITSQEAYGGGSTLTQQLAKNTLLTKDQTFLRKYQELAISIAIEQQYTKDQILDMYLNSSFFGENAFGIEDAAKAYFNKAPKDLNLAESAMLIGVLPAPSAYSPISGNPKYAKERQTTVLTRMVTNGFITEEQKQAALAQELAYADPAASQSNAAPHFTEMVLEELYEKYGQEKVIRSGYQVATTLDLALQAKLKANIDSHISYIERNGGSNASGIVIDPTSGEVRALVGSADWDNPEWGKVNMATTRRQPGSSFKPIYYSQALADGIITPATVLQDVATDFNGYKPQNASRTFSGDISVRNALSRSLNIPAVKVMQQLGIGASIDAAKRMGITTLDDSQNYGLSLALGSAEVPLIEMANAYAAFANGGDQYPTTIVAKINDKYGSTIFQAEEKSKQVMSPGGAYLTSSILSDNNARAPIFGSSLTVSGRTAAVKTGTTDNQRDAWTIGYTPQLVVGVWVGNNNNAAMINGGSGMAGPIWRSTLQQALQGTPNTPFTIPPSVIQKAVCYGSGALANSSGTNTYDEYFLASALPTTTCNSQQKVEKVEEKPKETEQQQSTDQTETDDTTGDDDDETPDTGNGSGSTGGGTTNPGSGTGGGVTIPGTGGTTLLNP